MVTTNTTAMYWIKTKEHGGDVMMETFWNSVGIRIVYIMNYHMKIYTIRRNNYHERIKKYCVNVI